MIKKPAKLLINLLFIFICFLLLLATLNTDLTFANTDLNICPAGKIDLVSYYLPKEKNTTVEVHHYNSSGTETGIIEHFYTYSSIVSNNNSGFYFVKSKNPAYFEEFSFDNEYLYHLKDTTWTEKCPDGQDAFYALFDGSLGDNGCNVFETNKEGAKWVDRCLAVGETSGPYISTLLGFNKESCDCCMSLPGTEIRTLSYQGAYTFPNGWHSNDLIIIETPGGEKYFIDNQYGMIAFEGGGYRTYPVKTEASSRQVNIFCDLNTKKDGIVISGSHQGFFDGNVDFEKKHENSQPAATPSQQSNSNLQTYKTSGQDKVLSSFLGLFEKQNVHGNIEYHEVNFPDFSPISGLYKHTLGALLPFTYDSSLAGAVTTKITTRVYPYTGSELNQLDKESGTSCEQGAQHEQTVSGAKWGQAASATVGLNLLQPVKEITEEKYFKDFQYEAESVDFSCPAGFGSGDDADAETEPPKPKEIKPNFILSKLTVITKLLESMFDRITGFLTQKLQDQYKVLIVFDNIVPMAKKSASYAKTLGIGLAPAEESKKWKPIDEAKALTVQKGAKVGVSLSPPVEDYHPIIYGSLGEFRNYNCLAVCGAYAEKAIGGGQSIIGADKICPSCDPKDYEADKAKPRTPCKNPDGTPDWDKDPQECVPEWCNWNSNYFACDYGGWCNPNNNALPGGGDYPVAGCPANVKPQIESGCEFGKDPVCEDCQGLPGQLYPHKDVRWCGGEGGERDCETHPCQILNRIDYENDIYDDPRYNGCYYANAALKVKREDPVNCASICNDACPAY